MPEILQIGCFRDLRSFVAACGFHLDKKSLDSVRGGAANAGGQPRILRNGLVHDVQRPVECREIHGEGGSALVALEKMQHRIGEVALRVGFNPLADLDERGGQRAKSTAVPCPRDNFLRAIHRDR